MYIHTIMSGLGIVNVCTYIMSGLGIVNVYTYNHIRVRYCECMYIQSHQG